MTEAKWRTLSQPEKMVWSNMVAMQMIEFGESAKTAVATADRLIESLPAELGLNPEAQDGT